MFDGDKAQIKPSPASLVEATTDPRNDSALAKACFGQGLGGGGGGGGGPTDGVETNMCTRLERKPKPLPYEGSWGTYPIKKLGPQRDPTHAKVHGPKPKIETTRPGNQVI